MTQDELNICFSLRRELDSERARIESLRLSASQITQRLDGLPRSKATASRPERITLLILETQEHIRQLEAQLDKAAASLVIKLTESITNAATLSVMIRRYAACCPFAEIATSLNYSRSHVGRLHEAGLSELGLTAKK